MTRDCINFVFLLLLVALVMRMVGDPNPPPPFFVDADYEQCVGIKNSPLLRSPDSKVDYRFGEHFNDKGVT